MTPAGLATRSDRVENYLLLMQEIKTRIGVIDLLKQSTLESWLAHENCVLQLRHIYELIAIGTLIVQGKMHLTSALLSEDNPGRIFKSLARWGGGDGFFQQPVTAVFDPNGNVELRANTRPNALTRRELESFWNATGNHLHRLNVRNFLRRRIMRDQPDWDSINQQVSKIVDLLTEHLLLIPDYGTHPVHTHYVLLSGKDGNPQINTFDQDGNGGIHLTENTVTLMRPPPVDEADRRARIRTQAAPPP